MDNKKLLKQIAVMQAHLNGKEIEFGNLDKNEESYIITTCPSWNWEIYDYRVKKSPPKERTDVPLFTGYMKKQKRNEITVNTTLFDQLDQEKNYLIKVYEIKQKQAKE